MSEQPTGMDLEQFVKDVILEVMRAVNEAADNVREAHIRKRQIAREALISDHEVMDSQAWS